MTSLLVKTQRKMAITARRPVHSLLDGEYLSVFTGRSLDFEDLRDYVVGDDVKDIDWNGSARVGRPLVRRYVASRNHTIMVVLDTGRTMATAAPDGSVKRDLAVFAAGVIGWLALRNGDFVMAVIGDADTTRAFPPQAREAGLEAMLRFAQDGTRVDSADGGVGRQLDYIRRHVRRRTILFVITDQPTLSAQDEDTVRLLGVQHEIVWLSIATADPTDPKYRRAEVADVVTDDDVPGFVRRNRALHAEYARLVEDQRRALAKSLERREIVHETVRGEDEVITQVFRLLEKKKRVRP
jgi:uncharacterized protein (DUF58 family)